MEVVDRLISWSSMKRRKKYETKGCKNVRCEGGEQYFINDGRQTSLFTLMRDGVSVDDILGVSFSTTGSLKLKEYY